MARKKSPRSTRDAAVQATFWRLRPSNAIFNRLESFREGHPGSDGADAALAQCYKLRRGVLAAKRRHHAEFCNQGRISRAGDAAMANARVLASETASTCGLIRADFDGDRSAGGSAALPSATAFGRGIGGGSRCNCSCACSASKTHPCFTRRKFASIEEMSK